MHLTIWQEQLTEQQHGAIESELGQFVGIRDEFIFGIVVGINLNAESGAGYHIHCVSSTKSEDFILNVY